MATLHDVIDDFCTRLRRRQQNSLHEAKRSGVDDEDNNSRENSLYIAKRTAEIMRLVITAQRHADAVALIKDVSAIGVKLQNARPAELSIGNTVRKVLYIIREEKAREEVEAEEEAVRQAASVPAAASGTPSDRPASGLSLAMRTGSDGPFRRDSDLTSSSLRKDDDSTEFAPSTTGAGGKSKGPGRKLPQWRGKQHVIAVLNEYIEEFDNIVGLIVDQAPNHIHANEIILTIGYSTTVFRFLRAAAHGEEDKIKRQFQVVVAEGAPSYGGRAMARDLTGAGIPTTVITDSAIFAMMARVNKVVISAAALLANGGLLAPVGTQVVAQAAKMHAVPVVVLVGLHKLSPLFPHDPELTMNDFRSPAEIIEAEALSWAMSTADPAVTVHVANPLLDYVPPNLVSLLVTDVGGYNPSFVYRLVQECYYAKEDEVLLPSGADGTKA